MVELVDTPDLGSGAVRCESSSLSSRTILFIVKNKQKSLSLRRAFLCLKFVVLSKHFNGCS
ncbi:protein of unknown function [Shewanella benthica]|uniref:Uncharacterized protein n=1 Tax=Shewanella benthica TaxID=43661 RepID=A0A330M7L7_9GAMM|nr:protein of unknown function [Shewanella benthica]